MGAQSRWWRRVRRRRASVDWRRQNKWLTRTLACAWYGVWVPSGNHRSDKNLGEQEVSHYTPPLHQNRKKTCDVRGKSVVQCSVVGAICGLWHGEQVEQTDDDRSWCVILFENHQSSKSLEERGWSNYNSSRCDTTIKTELVLREELVPNPDGGGGLADRTHLCVLEHGKRAEQPNGFYDV